MAAGEKSLWDLYKDWTGLPADTELPTTLDARRGGPLARCQGCGGTWFVAAISFHSDGTPNSVLPPQRCLGCGQHRKTTGPS